MKAHIIHKLCASFTALAMTVQPIIASAAPIIIDARAPVAFQPQISSSTTGVPVIHITNPSPAGVSHNKFETYNVESQGVILNNSNSNTFAQLGGEVEANPLLLGSAASVIMNEVTSNSHSNLEGITEITGNQAALIIANPNGISCRGCGFINTPRVSLIAGATTGNHQPDFALQSGAIEITDAGVNTSTIQQLDLVAKTLALKGNIQGNKRADIYLMTGQGTYSHAQNELTPDNTESNAIAIDATSLGAIEAGNIHIISTDKGAGVNMAAAMDAVTGSFSLSAAGDIILEKQSNITTAGDINVSTTGNLTKQANSYSFGNSTIQAHHLENKGRIEADGDIQLDVIGNYRGTGKLDASNNMAINVQGEASNSGMINTEGTLDIRIGRQFYNQDIKILSLGTISITGEGDFHNNDTDMFSNQPITLDVGSLQHSGTSFLGSPKNITLTVQRDIENLDSNSTIQSEQTLTLTGKGELNNTKGNIIADTLHIQMGSVQNQQGTITATSETGKSMIAAETAIENKAGTIQSNHQLTLTAAQIDNTQGQILTNQELAIILSGDNQQLTNKKGVIHSNSILTITSDEASAHIDNTQGTLSALEELSIKGEALLTNSQGIINTNNNLSIQASDIINTEQGTISAAEHIVINATGDITNDNGNIISGGDITATAHNISNQQGVINAENITLNTVALLDNTAGTINSNYHLTLESQGDIINNQGIINAPQALNLIAADTLSNDAGTIISDGNITLQAQHLTSTAGTFATLGETTGVNFHISDSIYFDTITLLAPQDITLESGGITIANSQIESSGHIFLNATLHDLVIDNSELYADTGITLNSAANSLLTQSTINTPGNIMLNAAENIGLHQLALYTPETITLEANNIYSQEGTSIHADKKLDFMVRNTIALQQTVLSANESLHLQAQHLTQHASSMVLQKEKAILMIDLLGELNQQEGIIHSNGMLAIGADNINIDEASTITAIEPLTIAASNIHMYSVRL